VAAFFEKSGIKLLLAWACGVETGTVQKEQSFLRLFTHQK
jgi:hypothetical protein